MPADGNTNTQSPDYVRKTCASSSTTWRPRRRRHHRTLPRTQAVIINYEDYLSVAPLLRQQPAPAQ